MFFCNMAIGMSFYFTSLTIPYHQAGEYGYLLLNENQIGWYISLFPLAVLLGTIVSDPMMEKFGRLCALLFAGLVMVVSSSVMYFATTYIILLNARLLGGVAIGIGSLVPFVYLSELATITWRHELAVLVNLVCSFGILFIYGMNSILPPQFLTLPVVVFLFIFLLTGPSLLPESPHWLIRNGRLGEAESVLRKLRGAKYGGVQLEINEVIAVSRHENHAKSHFVER